MKQYKAMIIDGKKIIKGVKILLGLAGAMVLLTAVPERFSEKASGGGVGKILAEAIPAMEEQNITAGQKIREQGKALLSAVFQFDWREPNTVLAAEVPLADAVTQTGAAYIARQSRVKVVPTEIEEKHIPDTPVEIPPERQAPIKEVNAAQKPDGGKRIALGNETSYQVDPEELLKSPPAITMKGGGPKVLIVQTHATEAYAPKGSTVYDTQGNDRSEDLSKNVVRVGEVLCEVLENKGIQTIHDKTLHDTPSFNGSYASSLKAIEGYLEKYPSIQVVLDVHRDSIVYGDGTKAKVITEINGKQAAQLMFVVGTDQKGLTHPDWRENIKSAVHFQNAICEKYPTLMRHINLRRERFNGHTTAASMIIETGSSGNSLDEAIYGISLAGECIGDYLNSL